MRGEEGDGVERRSRTQLVNNRSGSVTSFSVDAYMSGRRVSGMMIVDE